MSGASDVEFHILGPVEVRSGAGALGLGGPKQRALLADLILNAGSIVSSAQLIDDLWGDEPPLTADHAVETYVSRLRGLLRAEGNGELLITRAPGYLLSVDPDRVDARRFERLVADGEAALDRGDAEEATALLRSADELWRGPALADVVSAPFAAAAAANLHDRRVVALEKRIEAELRMGKHRDLVRELEALATADPYRESLRELLMLALYRSGRQADALAAYRDARSTLVAELGIEPGPALQRLEQAILRQDPGLEYVGNSGSPAGGDPGPSASAAPDSTVVGEPPARSTSGPRWRGRLPVVAAVLAFAVLAAVLPSLLRGRDTRASIPENGVGILTPNGDGVADGLALPTPLGSMIGGAGALWVSSPEGHVVYRIDPATRAVVQTISVGAGAEGLAIGEGVVWVANSLVGTVSRIDVSTNRVVQTIGAGSRPTGMDFGEGSVWATDPVGNAVFRIDPVTGRLIRTIALSSAPSEITVGGGSVWVASRSDNSITRIDPITGQAGDRISVGGGPSAAAFGFGSIWVANGLDSTVSRIDPRRRVVTDTIPVGNGPSALAVTPRGVWVANAIAGTLSLIDAGRGQVVEELDLGHRPDALATVGDEVWVGVRPSPAGNHGGGTLRVLSSRDFGTIDPALAYPGAVPQYLVFAYDTLVTYQRVGGSNGLQVVPDLAVSLPTPTDGGTTYAFTLRPGLVYSNGEPLRPTDFQRGLERVFSLNAAGASFFTGLEGADACVPGSGCDLSKGITVDDHADTVTFHLSAPDPDFLDKLAFFFTAPVPAGVPDDDVEIRPIPSTGPYMIDHYSPGREVEFVRNPHFDEWSAAAQPDGLPDRIVWTFGMGATEATRAIENGQADWTADPPAGFDQISARFPEQVHVNPLFGLAHLAFNVRERPFDDVRVRRAVSFAADRARMVSLLGGEAAAQPTCQILPPGIPGYRPFCPFTTDPDETGTWIGPDLTRARRLIASSGTEGMKVAVWAHESSFDVVVGRFAVSLLRELGYRASLRLASDADFGRYVNDSRQHVQASVGAWIADYPSASDFLGVFFRCSAFRLGDPDHTRSATFFCDPEIDRQMDEAGRLQTTDPRKAAALWATADREVTSRAPWVPFVNFQIVDFVSARVGNYQFHPLWGILLDQLWIR